MERIRISYDDMRNSFIKNAIEEWLFLQESRWINSEIKRKIEEFVIDYLIQSWIEFENSESFEGQYAIYRWEVLRRLREYKKTTVYNLDKKRSEIVQLLKSDKNSLKVLDNIIDSYIYIVFNELWISSIDWLENLDDVVSLSKIRKAIEQLNLIERTKIDELANKILKILKKFYLRNCNMKSKIKEKLVYLEAFRDHKKHLRVKDIIINWGLPTSLVWDFWNSRSFFYDWEIDELEHISRMLSWNEHIIDTDWNSRPFLWEDGVIYE